jgi:glycerol uptake facilitator-like aquaporin
MVSEGIGIFFLITIPLNTALRCVAGTFAPLAIGMTVAFCIMSFGAVTAASINTARALGAGDRGWQANRDTPPCMFAQFIGAGVAALLYRLISNRSIGDEKDKAAADEPAF